MNEKIAVAGATGRTGRWIVQKLLERGVKPHALVRDLDQAAHLGEGSFYFQSDVRYYETLLPALAGMAVVISAVGARVPVGRNCPQHVDYEGVANLVRAAEQTGATRFILISSIAVTHPEHPLNRFGKILDWKLKGEQTLRASQLTYTIIRPGGLKDTPGGQHCLAFDQGDRITGTVSRADLAEACLQALIHPESERRTFEMIEANRPGPMDWQASFADLKG